MQVPTELYDPEAQPTRAELDSSIVRLEYALRKIAELLDPEFEGKVGKIVHDALRGDMDDSRRAVMATLTGRAHPKSYDQR